MLRQIFAVFTISLSFALGNRHLLQTTPTQTNTAYGNYDQLCFHSDSTATCESITDSATDITTPGFTNCDIPNSCCLCTFITCGTNTIGCEIFSAGPYSAYGVQWIDIIGNNNNNLIPTVIDCKGDYSCANTMIKAKYITKVQCNGMYSCSNAMIIIDEPNIGFELHCVQMGSCDSLQIALNIGTTSQTCDDIIYNSIECLGIESCLDLLFVINNKVCNQIIMDSIECADNACENAQFKFTGNINIVACNLTSTELDKTIGLKQKCLPNTNTLACVGEMSCYNKTHNIIDAYNGFEVLCQGEYACSEAIIYINLDNNNNININDNFVYIFINCVTLNSCINTDIIIQNRINTKQVIVSYKCIGIGACDNAVFITSGISISQSIACGNILFCAGCKYNGVPCHRNDVILIQNPQNINPPNIVK